MFAKDDQESSFPPSFPRQLDKQCYVDKVGYCISGFPF